MTPLQAISVDKSLSQAHDFESLEKIKSVTSRELEFVSYKDALIQWSICKNKDELNPSDTKIASDGGPLRHLSGNDEKQFLKNSENVYMELVDYDDSVEFVFDEFASSCSNGIIVTENDREIDVKIDLEPIVDLDIVGSSFTGIINSDISISTFMGGRRYQSFCHPVRLPPDVNTNKVFSTYIDGKMHIKVPKNNSDIIEKSLAMGYCAICEWKECLSKYFPGLSYTNE
ncbi:4254_t:CDS:2 [Racocetra fulgida]|uniref:4254_t:CDS:1 n=1 Tax=Racocetra fulgida TaxID=60492 RepID=A0A9N9FDJ0_9GLOM|nr:4254_t:CDS:2 [Racocetra fulgida]